MVSRQQLDRQYALWKTIPGGLQLQLYWLRNFPHQSDGNPPHTVFLRLDDDGTGRVTWTTVQSKAQEARSPIPSAHTQFHRLIRLVGVRPEGHNGRRVNMDRTLLEHHEPRARNDSTRCPDCGPHLISAGKKRVIGRETRLDLISR